MSAKHKEVAQHRIFTTGAADRLWLNNDGDLQMLEYDRQNFCSQNTEQPLNSIISDWSPRNGKIKWQSGTQIDNARVVVRSDGLLEIVDGANSRRWPKGSSFCLAHNCILMWFTLLQPMSY